MANKTPQEIEKQIIEILEDEWWLPSIKTKTNYARLHDDHDGTMKGIINVAFSPDGDGWINVLNRMGALRFRNWMGGGKSQRTHKALQILALAIKLDQEEKPDPYK